MTYPRPMIVRTSLSRKAAVGVSTLILLTTNIVDPRVLCEEMPRSNLSIFQLQARELGRQMGESLGGEDSASIEIILRPSDQAWILLSALTQGLSNGTRKAVLRDGDISAECTISAMGVSYEEGRRPSLFGERVVDRIVQLRIQALIADRRSGKVLSSAEYATSSRDTIEVSDISRLEDASIPATRGEVPREGFFSTFAEPMIMIGAVAVSVLLLFHVRS